MKQLTILMPDHELDMIIKLIEAAEEEGLIGEDGFTVQVEDLAGVH
jgi:hypothetical protein